MSEHKTISIDPKDLSVRQCHLHLLAAVAPRPIALASTIDASGQVNLSPFSFFNVFSANPPVMIFSPSRRGRDNTEKHTYQNLLEVPEVSINVVTFPMVEQVSLSSTEYDKGVDEFIKSGLTPVASDKIQPPRVAESPVSFECTVDQIISLGTEGGAGNLVLARVVRMHINEGYLDEKGQIDTTLLDLVGRMGGSWYSRTNQDALFEIPKPLSTKGIGVDSLPIQVQQSEVLTGNELGRLGNLDRLPNEDELLAFKSSGMFRDLLTSDNPTDIHQKASELLKANKAKEALTLLISASL